MNNLSLFLPLSSSSNGMAKAIFASDIDKTLTDERHLIPDEVIVYLENLHKDGWEIVLLTGRTFSFAMMSVEKINFPFFLAVQNGAEVLKMPGGQVVFQSFMPKSVAFGVDSLYHHYKEDFLIYSGLEKGDFCYYRSSKFSPFFIDYLEKLKTVSTAEWIEFGDLSEIPQTSFPLIKCFSDSLSLQKIQGKLTDIHSVTSSIIMDSFDPKLPILLVTNSDVNKGLAFKRIAIDQGWSCPLVAAGDDNNDIPLLQLANISIAIKTGSRELQLHADILADSSVELGIIPALDEARRRLDL